MIMVHFQQTTKNEKAKNSEMLLQAYFS